MNLAQIKSIVTGTLEEPGKLVPALEALIALAPEVYDEYASKKAAFEYTKGLKDYKLANIINCINGSSMTAKREAAYATPEYKRYLDELGEAQKEYYEAQANLRTLETLLACVQSINKFVVTEYKANPLK